MVRRMLEVLMGWTGLQALSHSSPTKAWLSKSFQSGLGPSWDFQSPSCGPKPGSSSIHSKFSYILGGLFLASAWSWGGFFCPNDLERLQASLTSHWHAAAGARASSIFLSTVVSTSNSCSISPGKQTTDEASLTLNQDQEVKPTKYLMC